MSKRVLFWGRFDPAYSRNRVYAALFRELGWTVDYFFVKISPRFGDVEQFFRGLWLRPKPDLVWVPVARQRDVLAACRWAHRRGIPVVFDPMISAWDKLVQERKKFADGSFRANRLLAREKKQMAAPDLVCWDTSCHADFCAEKLGVPREKLRVLFTGTDEKVFKPEEGLGTSDFGLRTSDLGLGTSDFELRTSDDFRATSKVQSPPSSVQRPPSSVQSPPSSVQSPPSSVQRPPSSVQSPTFRVLYHGAYLPLHGTPYIVQAARLMREENVQWDFLGWGAYKKETELLAQDLVGKNVRFLDKVPYEDVPKVIAAHDVVLGVFGTTPKAGRVIGNKVFECMACGRPTINEFCSGYPPEARFCKAIKFVPAGDARAIADAVREYRDDWANRDSYFAAARDFFVNHLSMAVVKKQLQGILEEW